MKQDKNNIEKILQSLDGIGRADAPDFFYTRLQARMENELLEDPARPFLLRPVFLTICLMLILTINIFTLTQINQGGSSFNKQAPATIETFAKEYNIDNAELY
jgi:hypothetical protein